MHGPAKNRLHDYEAGWLSMLVKTGLATRREAEEAQGRVMQETIERMHEEKKKRRGSRRKRGEE